MSLPDLSTDEGRAAYRAELMSVGRPYRLGGLALVVLGAGYIVATRYGGVPGNEPLTLAAYGALAVGWALFLVGRHLRTRHHKRRLAEGL